MASLDMNGPYDLAATVINKQVTTTSPGNYALGHVQDGGTFIVQYVGRADSDVNGRIRAWERKYPKFKYSLATSPKTAFEKECRNYHDFGGPEGKLHNEMHPDRPNGAGWECPVCTIFDK